MSRPPFFIYDLQSEAEIESGIPFIVAKSNVFLVTDMRKGVDGREAGKLVAANLLDDG